MRIRLPSMTTPVPPTSIGFCLVHGRTGLGSRITLVTRTIESSGPPAHAEAVGSVNDSTARLRLKTIVRTFMEGTSPLWSGNAIGSKCGPEGHQ